MTDTTVTTEAKPKRKYVRKPKTVLAQSLISADPPAAPPVEADDLAGLTANDCCSGCTELVCVITGKSYCGHPYKGGLRYGDMYNAQMINQLSRAKSKLAHAVVDKRIAQGG